MNYWDDYEWLHHEDEQSGCLGAIVYALAFWLAILLCCLLGGCKSVKYIPVPEHHTDTLYINKVERDSIWLHDSVHVVEKQVGDTIYMLHDRWHTKYVESIKHDTIYQSKTDSIDVPYPIEVKVEKPLSWWQKTRLRLGELLLGIIGVFGIIGIIKLKKIFMP